MASKQGGTVEGQSHTDLIVWQKAVALATDVHKATKNFPKGELYGLVSQLRRATVSISSNIAEGQGRLTTGEFKHALGIARGSLFEVQTQIHISRNLRHFDQEIAQALLDQTDEVGRLLNGLIRSLQN